MELPGIIDIKHKNLLPKDGVLEFQYPFIKEDITQELISEIKWSQDQMQMFGKIVKLPRLTAWYGDPNASYSYSGINNKPLKWNSLLLELKQKVEKRCQCEFNSVLLNYYRDGHDHMSWHNDNEKELGENPTIASLSFGQVRNFQLKHASDKRTPNISIKTEPGSLIIMRGEIQKYWLHRVSKTTRQVGPRINLTFRKVHT